MHLAGDGPRTEHGYAQVRSRVWPVLLGVKPGPLAALEFESFRHGKHRDSTVVECDVHRSLWSYTEGGACNAAMLCSLMWQVAWQQNVGRTSSWQPTISHIFNALTTAQLANLLHAC